MAEAGQAVTTSLSPSSSPPSVDVLGEYVMYVLRSSVRASGVQDNSATSAIITENEKLLTPGGASFTRNEH